MIVRKRRDAPSHDPPRLTIFSERQIEQYQSLIGGFNLQGTNEGDWVPAIIVGLGNMAAGYGSLNINLF